MGDRQAMLGKRVEVRQKYQRMVYNCEALRDKLRELVGVSLEAGELERDAILDTAALLHAELGEFALLVKKLSILNRELGD